MSQYFVSAKGTPPPTGLTFAGIPQSGLLPAFSSNFLITMPPPMPDYNGNGIVDAADYTVWRDSLGRTGSGLAADGDGSGAVDQADYSIWKSNFGNHAGSGSGAAAAVPEPTTLLMFLFGILAISFQRRVTVS